MILTWIGAACRASQSDGITRCEPSISVLPEEDLSFYVRFQENTLSHDTNARQASHRWQNLFRNPTTATGFPIPLRTGNEHGLGMSADLIVFLTQTSLIACYNDRLLLKGYNTILAQSGRNGDSIRWYSLVYKDRLRPSYNHGLLYSTLRTDEEAFFPTARRFVGWSGVDVIAGKCPMTPSIVGE